MKQGFRVSRVSKVSRVSRVSRVSESHGVRVSKFQGFGARFTV